jgi:hypothetical protein
MVSATNIQSEQINNHYSSKDCEGWLPSWIFYKLKIMLQFAQFGLVHFIEMFIGMFGFNQSGKLSIGRRGRKSGHHGHKDFSQMCLWRRYIKHKSLIILLYFFDYLWKYILLMFWDTSFFTFWSHQWGGCRPLSGSCFLPTIDSDHYIVFPPLIHITSGIGRTKSGTDTRGWGYLGPLSMGSIVQIPRNQFGLIWSKLNPWVEPCLGP